MPNTVTFAEVESQLADYFGITPRTTIQIDGAVFDIPNPVLLDDDQQTRWDELQFELERCDRDADGNVITPHRTDGVLMKPPFAVRLATALWGEDGYAKYKAGGGVSNQISLEWARMSREFEERE